MQIDATPDCDNLRASAPLAVPARHPEAISGTYDSYTNTARTQSCKSPQPFLRPFFPSRPPRPRILLVLLSLEPRAQAPITLASAAQLPARSMQSKGAAVPGLRKVRMDPTPRREGHWAQGHGYRTASGMWAGRESAYQVALCAPLYTSGTALWHCTEEQRCALGLPWCWCPCVALAGSSYEVGCGVPQWPYR